MKLKFLRSKFTAVAAGTALCAALGAPARAANVTYTGQDSSGLQQWEYFVHGNWDTNSVPTGSDTAIFPDVLPADDETVNGVHVFLTNHSGLSNRSPIASDLMINVDMTLTGGTGKAPSGDALSTLTLTHGTVYVDDTEIAVIDAPIIVSNNGVLGTLNKTGNGDLVLTQSVKGNVTVSAGGLGGSFSVSGNLINNAYLAGGRAAFPGSGAVSTGNITVNGNFTQGKTGTLFIPIADTTPQGTSQIIVKGSATLAGTASAVFLNGFTPKNGTTFTVLTANGGLNGTKFDTVNTAFPAFGGPSVIPTYNSNSVVLTVGTAAFPTAAPAGITYTPNQQGVANNLNAVSGLPQYNPAFAFITKQGVKNVTKSLNSISPDSINSNHNVSNAANQAQSNAIQGHIDVLVAAAAAGALSGHMGPNGPSGFSAQGLAINGDGPGYSGPVAFRTGAAGPRGDDGKESKEMKAVAPEEDRWGAFLSGTGEWVHVGDTDAARGYDLASGGFTLGIDYKVTPNFAIGLMGGYIGTGVDLADNGRTWINGGKIGLYATTFVGGWYADTAVTGGYSSYSTRRSALGGDARSNTEGGDLNVLFGTGYDFHAGALTIGPTGSFNYTYTGVNSFDEHGSLIPLHVNSSHNESERMALGMKASYDIKMGGSAIFRPEVRTAWQHEFGDVVTSIASSFAAGGGGTFDATGPAIGRDSLLVGAGFAVQFNERCTTFLYYDGELARTNYISSAVTGGVRLSF